MENGGSILLSTGCWRAVDPFSFILYCAYCCLYVKTNREWWIYPSLHYNFGSFHRLLESGGSILPMGNGGSILLCTIILAISTGCWGAVDPFFCILYCAYCCIMLRPMKNGGSILLCAIILLFLQAAGERGIHPAVYRSLPPHPCIRPGQTDNRQVP